MTSPLLRFLDSISLIGGIATVIALTFADWGAPARKFLDIGFCGVAVNTAIFATISLVTKRLPRDHVARFETSLTGKANTSP